MAPSTNNDHYIGFRVSLTSKSAIRYIGTLCSIDTKLSTVALKDVRSFGTEGRLRDGGPVMPSECIYPYIIFRASDILDLQVLSKPPAPSMSPLAASNLPSNLLPSTPLAFSSNTTSMAMSNSDKSGTNVSNMSDAAPPFFSSAQPSTQLARNAMEDLPISTPWTYDGFDSFDLNLAKSYSGESSGARTSVPKASKFAPLYPPTTAMLLPPYGHEEKQNKGNSSGNIEAPGIDSYRTASPFDLSLSQGFGNFRQFPLGILNSDPVGASSSERLLPSSNSSNGLDNTKFDSDASPVDSTEGGAQDKPKARETNLQPMSRPARYYHKLGSESKSEPPVEANPPDSSESVKAPVPRAWGPPPVAAAQGQLSGKTVDSSRSGNDLHQHLKEGSEKGEDEALNPNLKKAAMHTASGRIREGGSDRVRRGGRRGRWAYGVRRREGRLIEVPKEDFNFEEMHEKLAAIQQEGNEYPPVDPRYDKSKSFFDNLVSEKDVRTETSVSQQRAKDAETFGEAGAKAHSRRRGGNRNGHHAYRGRPARARARGRGR